MVRDWPSIREAYVTESPKPTYTELSERFNAPIARISRVASDEGWAEMRAHRLERADEHAQTLALLHKAAKDSEEATSMTLDVMRSIYGALLRGFALMEKDPDAKSRALFDSANTASFAVSNTCNALHRVGILGFPGSVKRSASETGGVLPNGHWDPKLMQQINVTVQNMQAGKAPGSELAKPVGDLPAGNDTVSTIAEDSQ